MEIINLAVRLTADPDALTKTPSGKVVVSFNAAHNWRTRAADGWTDVETTWFRCTLWEEDGAANFAELGLKKGDLLKVSGRWAKNSWKDKTGNQRIGNNLTVTAVSVSTSTEIRREPAELEAPTEVSDTTAKGTRRRQAA